ncbi:MAG: hypothetical protein U0326_16740 [Polyangiales bacterium]
MEPISDAPPWPAALLALGLLMVLPYLVMSIRAWLDPAPLALILEKLFVAGDVDRAKKLTEAVTHLPLLTAVREVLVASREGLRPSDDASGYRDPSAARFEAQFASLRARYDETFARVARPLRMTRWLALVGSLPLVAAPLLTLTLAWDAVAPMWILAIAPLGFVMLFAAVYREVRVAQSRAWLFERLRPQFELLLRTGAPQTYREEEVVFDDNGEPGPYRGV